jgi:hypothetical protein
MPYRASTSLADWAPSSANLRRIRRTLRWLTFASVLAFVVFSAEGWHWWAARALQVFIVMLAADLVLAVPAALLLRYRALAERRRSRQALGDAYDEIIAARQRRSD